MNNTIIITGANRGIGLAITHKFLDEGWSVIATHRGAGIPIESSNLTPIQLDISSEESIAKAVAQIKKVVLKVDALVNNAGVSLDAKLETADVNLIRKTFETNLFGLIDFTEQLFPFMVKGSHIINIDSLYGAISFPIDDKTSTGYRMSKVALNMYSRALAYRLKNRGIIVSSFDPGWVKTEMGHLASTEDEKPDREVEAPAEEIHKMITEVTESGFFWKEGKKRDW